MITVSLILIALAIEYFYDDIKKYRTHDVVVKSYSLFAKFFNDDKYSKDMKFLLFLVAILFIIFDLEVAFLFPWAISLSLIGLVGYFSMMIFLLILTVGFVYEWKKGAVDWE